MTPRRRARRTAAVVVLGVALSTLLLACGPVASYGTAGPSYDREEPSASPSASPSGSADPSWAGSRAGEGRLRPGRPDEPGTATARPSGTGAADDVSASPSATVPGAADEGEDVQAVPGTDPSGPVLRILPLGSGLVLIGLGLGLAFLALRVRRIQG
ncbi:hypothetical protein AB0O67_29445 [Streptomyces sp. NPDC086077]|uniref:hypothetical protein n=1 Tax=Streptomyces sp. NPDC086077 TaxID=3154862 RepID=UPI003446F322